MAPGLDKLEETAIELLSEQGEATPSELLRLMRVTLGQDPEATNQRLRLAIWRLVERGDLEFGLDRKLTYEKPRVA